MNKIQIYRCENSIDGIFTAIYLAWSSKQGHQNIQIEEEQEDMYSNIQLFSDYIQVETNYELSEKVANSIRLKISSDAYQAVCRVALSNYIGKGDLIYRFLILGFHIGSSIMDRYHDKIVGNVLRIDKFVGREVHHLLGFIRFSEIEKGYLYSIIQPKNNVVSLVMPHFVDRLSMEPFLIYDENHNQVGLHVPGKPWVVLENQEWNQEFLHNQVRKEDEYEGLWRIFFQHIAIKERSNYKLQRNMLPLRFRNNMTEFEKN